FSRPISWGKAIFASVVFVAVWYATLLAVWRLLGGYWETNLSQLVGSGYANALANGTSLHYWFGNLVGIGRYFGAHLIVLSMIFPVSLVCLGAGLWRAFTLNGHGAEVPNHRLTLMIFVATSTICVLAMVANFSQAIGAAGPSEADRVHGRLYLFLL